MICSFFRPQFSHFDWKVHSFISRSPNWTHCVIIDTFQIKTSHISSVKTALRALVTRLLESELLIMLKSLTYHVYNIQLLGNQCTVMWSSTNFRLDGVNVCRKNGNGNSLGNTSLCAQCITLTFSSRLNLNSSFLFCIHS